MLNEEIKDYIKELTIQYPGINSIWLFGSRVNGPSRPDSDWDFLVFGTQETFDEIRQSTDFKRDNIDLIVVYNGNDFMEPWPTGRKIKTGTLSEWQWREINHQIAYYVGTKQIEGSDFCVEERLSIANKVFPGLVE